MHLLSVIVQIQAGQLANTTTTLGLHLYTLYIIHVQKYRRRWVHYSHCI